MMTSEVDKYYPYGPALKYYKRAVEWHKGRIAYFQSKVEPNWIAWHQRLLDEAQEKLDALTH